MSLNIKLVLKGLLIVLFLLPVLTEPAVCQENILPVAGKIETPWGSTGYARIVIRKNNNPLDTIHSRKNGWFSYDFKIGGHYAIHIYKTGFITKKISVDTFVPDDILNKNDFFPELQLDIELLRIHRGIDYELIKIQPVGEISYNKQVDDFEYTDFHYEDEYKQKIAALKESKSKEYEEFVEKLIEADRAFEEQEFEIAKQLYQEARTFQNNINYIEEQLSVIDSLKQKSEDKKSKAQLAEYQKWKQEADSYFNNNEYEKAIMAYQKALIIKPENTEIQKRLRDSKRRKSIQAEENRLATINAYRDTINWANEVLYNQKNFDEAIRLYRVAKKIKPKENYPDAMLQKIDTLISKELNYQAEKQSLNDWYNQHLQLAEEKTEKGNYLEAKEIYKKILRFQKVKRFKRDDNLPREKIVEIELFLISRGQAYRDSLQKLKNYREFVRDGNISLKLRQYAAAKTSYLNALKYKPNDSATLKKISQLDSIFIIQQEAEEQIDQKKQAYQELIRQAEYQQKMNNLDAAIVYYEMAADTLPGMEYPRAQIRNIRNYFQKMLEKEKLALQNQELYSYHIEKGDELFEIGDFDGAKDEYIQAIKVFPEREYPKKKMQIIEKNIQEKKNKEIEEKNVEQSYNALIRRANSAMKSKDYNKAKEFFYHALNLKPKENYPIKKIEEIDRILFMMAKAERAKMERLKAYDEAIKEADRYLASKQYDEARELYNEAQEYIPKETYPDERLKDIELLLTDMEYSKKQQKEKEKKYQLHIASGDSLLRIMEFNKAIIAYNEALLIFPGKQYPAEQIEKINEIQDRQFRDQMEKKTREEAFSSYVNIAKSAYQAKNYTDALKAYRNALKYKPGDTYTKNKIDEIQKRIEEQKKQREILKEKEKSYNKFLSGAELHFDKKEFTQAKKGFKQSLEIFPDKDYPKKRIDDIAKILEENEKVYYESIRKGDENFEQENYSVALYYYRKALELRAEDYPKKMVTKSQAMADKYQEQLRSEEYDEYIKKADEALKKEEFNVATFYYKKALEIRQEEYPKQKLGEIEIIREQNKQKAIELEYYDLIYEADQAFRAKEYSVAKFYYEKALSFKPYESYPKNKLKEIENIFQRRSSQYKN
jgi:tetratricopeptide (TPR) repeat protein